MSRRNPVAFLSYVRADDDHDFGAITKFRERLEGEVKVQSGQSFEIFQDRNDIRWGQFWDERITKSLSEVTFLIPIITPSFFVSIACRKEFDVFLKMEQTLGVPRLILPLYYVACDELARPSQNDPIAKVLGERQWTDWRSFRFKSFDQPDVRSALAELATSIKTSINELNSISEAAKASKVVSVVEPAVEAGTKAKNPYVGRLPAVLPEIVQSITNPKRPEFDYYVYTKQFDEVIEARELSGTSDQLLECQKMLSIQVRRTKRKHAAILLPRSATKITKDVAVTLLLDNSGSLRGKPIAAIAAWAVIIDEWCERAGINLEILGFTTRAWKGGQSKELWLARGKARNPGRLNDLRHIVYKSFKQSSENSFASLSVMMREGILKENIDGEALIWAHSRLEEQRAEKRILVVLSDGAPVDDTTLSVNPADFLEKHLMFVAAWLEAKTNLELLPIGFEFAPRYYASARKINDAMDIGLPVLERLNDLLGS
jgi:hypothetical protein